VEGRSEVGDEGTEGGERVKGRFKTDDGRGEGETQRTGEADEGGGEGVEKSAKSERGN